MGYDDVGKSAKHAGKMHPRHTRKLDPIPERRPPGAAKPHRKAEKPFGFEYQHRPVKWKKDGLYFVSDGYGDWEWREHLSWYTTAKRRDQAMAAWRKQSTRLADIYGEARPISRLPGS